MNKRKILIVTIVVILIAILTVGCAKTPQTTSVDNTNDTTIGNQIVNTYTVRHILIMPQDDSEQALQSAKEKAETILNEYEKGEKTEESFSELAKQYSEDPGSAENGGIYEDVSKGVMVKEFEGWALNSSRKYGDVEIIKSDYGYHIMYFVAHK